jgi:hypothetical protein
MSTQTQSQGQKENNRNAQNITGGYKGGARKFAGGNTNLQGKVFEITSKDAVHQFAETVKAIADYVGQEYTHGGDIRFMIENMADYNFVRPADPPANANEYEKESWKKQLDLFWKRRGVYMDNKMKLYSLIWGQSSKTTQSKLETHANFDQCKTEYDSLGLLKIIREFVFKSDDRQYKYKAEDQAKRAYYNLRQTPEMSCQEYFERVRNMVDVIKSLGGSLADDMHLSDELPARPARGYTEAQKQEARERILNKTVAYGILVRADRGRYGKLIEEIENDFLKGNNDYPKTPTEAYNLLVNYRHYSNNKRTNIQGGLDQVAFVTEGKRTRGNGDHSHITCFKCNKKGHYKSDCPEMRNTQQQQTQETNIVTATTLTTIATTLSTSTTESRINPMWILCDNESTVDIFNNKDILTNIRSAERPIKLKGIEGGFTVVDKEGDLMGYGKVYYHPQVTANVLSFFNIAKRFKSVKYDNMVKDAFMITRDDGSLMEFRPSDAGLYYYDFEESRRRTRRMQQLEKENSSMTMVIDTVEDRQRNFTKRELEGAEAARRLYVIVGRPGKKIFENMIRSGFILNNPITIQDYKNAIVIYGEDLGVLKGKTVKQKQSHVKVEGDQKPRVKHEKIILAIDLMYFTGLTFLITVCRDIRFVTATMISDRKKNTILGALKTIINLYKGQGHKIDTMEFNAAEEEVHTILADNEFQVLRDDIEELGIQLNVVAKDEHVPEVERQNRVIKERARAIIQTLPYRKLPKKMRVSIIQYVVYWMNNLPKEEQAESPREIIFNTPKLDFKTVCKLPFGAYVQVHDEAMITNTMEPRTTGAINLGPTGNIQGAHKFFSLATGEILTRKKWTELPVPSEVLIRLEEMATDPNDDVEDIREEDEGDRPAEEIREENAEQHVSDENLVDEINSEDEDEYRDMPTLREITDEEMQHLSGTQNALDDSMTGDTVITSNVTQDRVENDVPQHGYDLRPARKRDYSYRFTMLSLKAGLKRWGKKAKEAMLDELKLFLSEEVFQQLHNPTRKQMETALRIHCFVVEKRDGRIKARAVADGRTQDRYFEEETYSPTVKLESIMLSSLIDAHEQRNVVTIDIKGAFLKAKVPDEMDLIVKMDGELAELMCELDPSYKVDENGALYLKCLKALYGHIEAARLFYNDLNETLTMKLGFRRNQYDPCIYNKKTANGVITIRTHVDDLKASCRSMKQLEKFIQELKEVYKEITVHRGQVHDYLGMVMTYDQAKQSVMIDMERYIQESIRDFQEDNPDVKWKIVSTPATDNLFKTRENGVNKLNKKDAGVFHSTVAKLLFIAKRGRPDILLATSFLTTRVKSPDDDDWKKLIRVLSYLRSTINLHLTLHCTNLDKLLWYIDGSYAIHQDMKGQSGAVLMTGGCVVLTKSNKQKLNTRSSTESELIAVDDVLPTVQWTMKFMEEQGYPLKTLIKEDNRSTMLLMKNGRLSSGKRTKHLDIRYFYVKDLIDRGLITIEHCISEEMIADFFTKPIQGARFQLFRDLILNIPGSTLQYRSVLGNSDKENIAVVEPVPVHKVVAEPVPVPIQVGCT